MGIESPRIAADSATPRVRVYDQPINIEVGAPTSTPSYEGQVYLELPSFGEKGRYMYVAVDIGGTLSWVEVDTGTYIDSYTGKEWNPLSQVPGA